jgi:hypothetical protein
MFRLMMKTTLVVGLIATHGFAYSIYAEESPQIDTSYWPCEQILVPVVPVVVVWAGPPITGMENAWQQDETVESMVRRITSPDYDVDAADSEIADFTAKLDPDQKNHKLTLLFAGVIGTLNERRKKELNSIIRYSHGQSDRANRLSAELDEMVKLQDDPSQAAQDRLALMQKEMDIKQRMFDEREAFIQHLCTRPMVIEEKLGVLARAIAYYLD